MDRPVAIITGTSRGIGRTLASDGWTVVAAKSVEPSAQLPPSIHSVAAADHG